MGEPTVEIKEALKDAVNDALKNYFPRLESTSNVRVQFYNKFQREADEHDRDFLKKYSGDLDTTLIFAGLFSAVASAFIVAVQTQLQPDYAQLSYDVLKVIADARGLKVASKPSSDSPWTGPDPTLVHIQCILFSSLAASLLAAFVAMLGKQWLNRYSKVDMHGSLIDRSRDRQRKMDGMNTWGFNFVMESLPLMLQAALILLGYALSNYLFTIDKTVAAVIIGFTSFGLLFYGAIAVAAILSYNCPFQTPFSLIVRSLIGLINDRGKHLKRSRSWLLRTLTRMRKQLRSNHPRRPGTTDRQSDVELAMTGPFDHPPTMFGEDTNWEGYVLDSNCIAWMFEMSMDADVILDIIRFIPEVVWHADVRTVSLEKLYDTVLECFDRSSGHPVVIPKFKNKAYLSAKALLHVTVQRQCMGDEFDSETIDSISRRHTAIGYEGDPDLESTLSMIDHVFGVGALEPIRWRKFSFTDSHRAWMGRILLYRAWDSLEKGGPLPDEVRGFVVDSLQAKRPPPAPIVTNCLLVVGLVLGIQLHFDEQQATEKSHKFSPQINRIYEKLGEVFGSHEFTTGQINRALEAMKLIAPLSEEIATKSYQLFRVIMRAQLPQAPEKKWEASRLAMRGAFTWENVLPSVEDPLSILDFLNHHFGPTAPGGQNQDEPIQNALRALASVSGPTITQALSDFDLTQPSFVHGVRLAFQSGRPPKLRKAALLFLPRIADRWFNNPAELMGSNEMKVFCQDWATAVDDFGATDDIRKPTLEVFFSMVNSACWRTHIVPEKWALLKDFTSNPEDSEPFDRCLSNPELIHLIPNEGSPTPRGHWLAILWLRFERLSPDVRNKLELAMKGVSRENVDVCLSAVESEFSKVEHELLPFSTFSKDPAAKALKEKKKGLERAKKSLETFKGV